MFDFSRMDLVNLIYGGPEGVAAAVHHYAMDFVTEENLGGATHLCIGRLGDQPSESNPNRPARVRANVTSVPAIQIDDVGTKGEMPRLRPTVDIQTKPRNSTYLYKLTRDVTPDEYDVITQSISAAGYGDPNCTETTRLYRLQGSLPEGKEHRAQLSAVYPNNVYDPDTFLADLNVAALELEAIRRGMNYTGKSAPAGMGVEDEVVDWLYARGMVLTDGPWMKIRCPWEHLHTTRPRDGTKYKPATVDNLTRTFYCHHGHGREHATEEFLDWVFEQGGPEVRREYYIPRTLDMLAEAGVGGRTDFPRRALNKENPAEKRARVLAAIRKMF